MLRAASLAIGYPGHRVGEGLDVSLAPGVVLALLGPTGSGKTTLLKTLLGLLPPQGGAVTLEGRSLDAWPPMQRARRLAYVPQSQAGGFAYTVDDLVLMGRTAHGGLLERPSARDRQVAAAMIERLGIAHLAQRPVTMISSGERQLALIARALAQEARIVMLDEPTANLDFGNQGKVLREIRRLASEGLGVLFTTHDPNHASRFADEAILIRDGRMLAGGPVSQVIVKPTLEQLYGTSVAQIVAGDGESHAFLPG